MSYRMAPVFFLNYILAWPYFCFLLELRQTCHKWHFRSHASEALVKEQLQRKQTGSESETDLMTLAMIPVSFVCHQPSLAIYRKKNSKLNQKPFTQLDFALHSVLIIGVKDISSRPHILLQYGSVCFHSPHVASIPCPLFIEWDFG